MLAGCVGKQDTKGSYGLSDKPILKLAADQCVRMTHDHLHPRPGENAFAKGQEQEENDDAEYREVRRLRPP